MDISKQPILCDCCGKEIMAEVKDGKLIIIQHRHGKNHFSVTKINGLTKIEK